MPVYKLETMKRRERLRRRFMKGQRQIMGTKGKSIDLRFSRNGWITAAVWLEKNRGRNKWSRRMFKGSEEPQCQICDSTYLMLLGGVAMGDTLTNIINK